MSYLSDVGHGVVETAGPETLGTNKSVLLNL